MAIPQGLVAPSRLPWLKLALKGKKAVQKERDKEPLDKQDLTDALNKAYVEYEATDIVDAVGVPIKILLAHLDEEETRQTNCITLPLTTLLLVVYVWVSTHHIDAGRLGSAERSIEQDILENANFAFSEHFGHKDLHDVNSYADFWSWLNLGLVPLVFQHDASISEGANTSAPEFSEYDFSEQAARDRPFYMRHSRLIGGIRMTQVTSDEGPCKAGHPSARRFVEQFFGDDTCAGYGGTGFERAKEPFDLQVSPGDDSSLLFVPERKIWLFNHWTKDKLQSKLRELEVQPYVDRRTLSLDLTMNSYNVELGVYVVVYVSLRFSRGGYIWKRIDASALPSERYGGDPAKFIPDAIWCVLMLHIAIVEVFALGKAVCRKGFAGYREYMSDGWNVVDWVSLCLATLLLAIWLTVLHRTNEVGTMMGSLQNVDVSSPSYTENIESVFDAMDQLVKFDRVLVLIGSIFPMVIMLRLFKAFAAQPKLAVVTRTLFEAKKELGHFLIVFCTIFFAFATMAHILFGRDLHEFQRPLSSLNTCFRVMLGDFDWNALEGKSGEARAMVWFISFNIIMVLLMLNMLLAIVMDTYSAVKTSVGKSQSLYDQTQTLVRRTWQFYRKQRLGLRHIKMGLEKEIQSLKDESEDPLLVIDEFMRIVPGLGPLQARRLMTNAVLDDYSRRCQRTTLDNTDVLVRKLNYRMKKMVALLNIRHGRGDSAEESVDNELMRDMKTDGFDLSRSKSDVLSLVRVATAKQAPSCLEGEVANVATSSKRHEAEGALSENQKTVEIIELPKQDTNTVLAHVLQELKHLSHEVKAIKSDVADMRQVINSVHPSGVWQRSL